MVGEGFGSRGEIERKTHDNESQVLIPWRLTIRRGIIGTLLYLGVWAVVFLVWLKVSTWRSWVSFLDAWWSIILIPVVPIWCWKLYLLNRQNYAPKIENDNWPPPWGQANPMDTGFFGARDMPYNEPEQPEIIEHVFEGSISNDHGTSKHWRLRTNAPDAWARYARALTRWTIKPRFSVRSARFFRVPEQEFTNLVRGWLTIDLAEKTSPAPNAHIKLTAWGNEYMERLAEQ